MIYKTKSKISVYDPEVDALVADMLKMCLEHGIAKNKLIHETLKILDGYFVVGLENSYPLTFVVATSVAKAHYNLMIEIHGRNGNREELPWSEINAVHTMLAEYLADLEPLFAPDIEFEFRPEIVSKIRMMMNRFTSSHHSGAVGPKIWEMLTLGMQAN